MQIAVGVDGLHLVALAQGEAGGRLTAGAAVMCCGQKMTELVAGTTEAATEKHIPVYQVEGNLVKVQVGSVEHPMAQEHHIEFSVAASVVPATSSVIFCPQHITGTPAFFTIAMILPQCPQI